jgi:phospholipase A1
MRFILLLFLLLGFAVQALDLPSSNESTAFEKRVEAAERANNNPYGIALYQPTYILPFYYTGNPYNQVYQGTTPNNEAVMSMEFKMQMSFMFPIVQNILGPHTSLNGGYTQLSYWQVYTNSQYFRETNYSPEIFFAQEINPVLAWRTGIVHQSNGRGYPLERSWNRIYAQGLISGKNWIVSVKPWILIFQKESSDIDNPDIQDYLGNGEFLTSYKFGKTTLSLMLRNIVESGFSRGAEELDFSFPLHGHLRGFVQVFSGYGQSLIEYNHYTNSVGIGIALNDWI